MTEWAAKVLEGVPRIIPPQAWVSGQDFHYAIMEADALAAIAKLAEGDGLVERLLDETWWSYSKLQVEAAAHIAALKAQNRELALDVLASSGQAQEAYAAQLAAEAERDALRAKVARLEGALFLADEACEYTDLYAELLISPDGHKKARAALTDGAADE